MRLFTQLLAIALLTLPSFAAPSAPEQGINLQSLVSETQKQSPEPNSVGLVWWLPEEFWKATLQAQKLPDNQIEDFLKVARLHTMVVVVDGTMGPFGGVTYRSEDWVRDNTRLIDAKGTSHSPKSNREVDADTRILISSMKPVLSSMMGPMGENMHFLLFPAKLENGDPVAAAGRKGEFTISVGSQKFKWDLPLDSILPEKHCSQCARDCKGSWSFCPWCGKTLESKKP